MIEGSRETINIVLPAEDLIVNYRKHYPESIDHTIYNSKELHKLESELFVSHIDEITKVESPIHVEELLKRIREHYEVKKAGKRIQSVYNYSVYRAYSDNKVKQFGDFIWNAQMNYFNVRFREGDVSNIDLICDEEIGAACFLSINYQGKAPMDELIQCSSRLLGIKTTTAKVKNRIEGIINQCNKSKCWNFIYRTESKVLFSPVYCQKK